MRKATQHRNLMRDQADTLFKLSGIKAHSAWRVLDTLAERWVNSESREAWPAVHSIVKDSGVPRATTQRSLAALVEAGVLDVVSQGGGRPQKGRGAEQSGSTTRYRLVTVEEYRNRLNLRQKQPQTEAVSGEAKPPHTGKKQPQCGQEKPPQSEQKNRLNLRHESGTSPVGSSPVIPETPIATPEPSRLRANGTSGSGGTRSVDTSVSTGARSASRQRALADQRSADASSDDEALHRKSCQAAGCTLARPFALVNFQATFDPAEHVAPHADPIIPRFVRESLLQALLAFEMAWGWLPDLGNLKQGELDVRNRAAETCSTDDLRCGVLASIWAGDDRFDSALRAATICAKLKSPLASIDLPRWLERHVGPPIDPGAWIVIGRLDHMRRWGSWPKNALFSVLGQGVLAQMIGEPRLDALEDPAKAKAWGVDDPVDWLESAGDPVVDAALAAHDEYERRERVAATATGDTP